MGMLLATGLLLQPLAARRTSAASDAEQVHVALRSPRRLAISWASPSGKVDDLVVEEVVDIHRHDRRATHPTTTRRYEVQCGARFRAPCRLEAVYRSPLLLRAELDVMPGALYRYRIGPESGKWRQVRAPPGPGSPLRIGVVGDLGQTANSAATCRDLAKVHREQGLHAAILLGDLAYADTNASRWDSFGRLFDQEGCSEVPWLTIPGNHEIEPDELSGEPFLPYRYRYPAVQSKEPERVGNNTVVVDWDSYNLRIQYDFGNSFYGMKLGCLHLLALNPYTDSSQSSAQIQWLRSELQSVDRNNTPHLLLVTHSPWFHSSSVHQATAELATKQLMSVAEPIVDAAQVDMVFSGHVHAYERSKPVKGTRHFVLGHGGNYEGLYDRWLPWEDSSFRAGDHYGWGILHLTADTAHWQARRSSDGRVVDETHWMSRPAAAAAAATPKQTGQPAAALSRRTGSPALPLAVALLILVLWLLGALWLRRRCRTVAKAISEERTGFKGNAEVIGAAENTHGPVQLRHVHLSG